jgi:hypothetical protein
MSDLEFGTWVSRIIRWALAIMFAWMAYYYEGVKFLYIFSLILFITGFLVPRQCVSKDGACNVKN